MSSGKYYAASGIDHSNMWPMICLILQIAKKVAGIGSADLGFSCLRVAVHPQKEILIPGPDT
jgi:hypothetical protein